MKVDSVSISKVILCLGLVFLSIGLVFLGHDMYMNKTIDIDSIVFKENMVTLNVNDTMVIEWIISPTTATNKEVEWTSSDPSVVFVNNGIIKGISGGKATITAKTNNGMIATCEVEVIMPRPQNVAISIPTYNQAKEGYILGCEGISLYMSLKGLGYINDYSVDRFMSTMPKGKTPFEGFSGNPKIGHFGENEGKRTTIYPESLTKWANNFANATDLTGASIETIKDELAKGKVVLAYVTSGWLEPKWKKYSWSLTEKGEVENNHCLCVVGYRENGDFLVNDCHDGRVDGRQGEYWVSAKVFESIYNARNYAVSIG